MYLLVRNKVWGALLVAKSWERRVEKASLEFGLRFNLIQFNSTATMGPAARLSETTQTVTLNRLDFYL